MESALVDQLLDQCSQIRILLVGSSKGKPALIREVFGVSRVLRYPPSYSRDEEVYSDENAAFIVHVFDDWSGVEAVLRRRNEGRDRQPDEVIHLIWHYVDAQDATRLVHEESMQCPLAVVGFGVPVVTLFGRFDNVVSRAAQIGRRRRLGEKLSEADEADAAHIRGLRDSINLFMLQYPDTVAVGSKDAASKVHFLTLSLSLLKQAEVRTLLIIAQRLEPTVKFEAALSLAMRQFLLGTISTASPLPIPFAGLAGSSSATYLIKQDILRVWNIYDPDFLCATGGVQGETTMLDRMLEIPKFGAKYLLRFIPVVAQIRGVWETPRMAAALGSLMIDLVLLMERCFLCNMGIETNARIEYLAKLPPPPARNRQFFHTDRDDDDEHEDESPQWREGVATPLSEEVKRNRREFMTGSREGTPVSDRGDDSPAPRKPARPIKPLSLSRPATAGERVDTPPPKPRRPGSAAPSPAISPAPGSPAQRSIPTPPPKPQRPGTLPTLVASAATPNIKSPLSGSVLNNRTPSTGANTATSTPLAARPGSRSAVQSAAVDHTEDHGDAGDDDDGPELLVLRHGSRSPSPSPPATPAPAPAAASVPAVAASAAVPQRRANGAASGRGGATVKTPLPPHMAREYTTPLSTPLNAHSPRTSTIATGAGAEPGAGAGAGVGPGVGGEGDRPALPSRRYRSTPSTPIGPSAPDSDAEKFTAVAGVAIPHTGSVADSGLERPSTPSRPVAIRPRQATTPLSAAQLHAIGVKFKPVHERVLWEVEDFFDLEGAGLKRSFQKNTVHRFLEGLVRKYRVTDVIDI